MLPACDRCGTTAPRMHGLMSRWFAGHAGVRDLAGSYFHLCPGCFDARVAPHLDTILHAVDHEHPQPDSAAADAADPAAAPPRPSSPRLRLVRAGRRD